MTTISDYYSEETAENLKMEENKLSTEETPPQDPKPISPSPLHKNKSVLGRVFHPPKLERKHSSGDLHSRLKTRKILGVGETDNGDIHRSKISQVLGHNDHLYMKLPKGIRNWQSFLALFMATQAVFILIFPNTAYDLGLTGVSNVSNPVASQYYAGTMLALAFLLWKFVNMNDKAVSRAVQTAAVIHFTLLFLVDILYALRNDGLSLLFDTLTLTVCVVRLAVALLCMFYLGRLGAATSGLRKSPSYKELVENSRNN